MERKHWKKRQKNPLAATAAFPTHFAGKKDFLGGKGGVRTTRGEKKYLGNGATQIWEMCQEEIYCSGLS